MRMMRYNTETQDTLLLLKVMGSFTRIRERIKQQYSSKTEKQKKQIQDTKVMNDKSNSLGAGGVLFGGVV
jgi:hypothetical protein